MNITITDKTDEALMRRACDKTRKPGLKPSTISREKLLMCEHSPVRLINFWLELNKIPTFVSVHLTRHKHGVEHYVESNRDDRGGLGDDAVNRLTPVNHGLSINAQALINMSRKRLCYNSHRTTVAIWMKLKKAMRGVDKDMADFMVPECVYRGFCPELKQCKPGVAKVLLAYRESPMMKERIKQLSEIAPEIFDNPVIKAEVAV